jgi:hypothetical protein
VRIERPDATPLMRAWMEAAYAFLRRLAPRVPPNRGGIFRPQDQVARSQGSGAGTSTNTPPGGPASTALPQGGTTAGATRPSANGSATKVGDSGGGSESIATAQASIAASLFVPATAAAASAASAASNFSDFGVMGGAAGSTPFTSQPAISKAATGATSFGDEFGNALVDRFWSPVSGTWTESAGQLHQGDAGGGAIAFTGNTITDGSVQVTLVNPGYEEIWIRNDATMQNGYRFLVAAGAIEVVVAGVGTTIGAGIALWAPGDVLQIAAIGGGLAVYQNGAPVVTVLGDFTFSSGGAGLAASRACDFSGFVATF